jgi:AraC-like DNA-binding protein
MSCSDARVESVYVERLAAADLTGHVQSIWYRRVGDEELARPMRVLPDGCMDLIWTRGGLLVAGPDTAAQVPRFAPGTEVVALRFRPGAAVPVLGVPAHELVDMRVDAAAIWGPIATDVSARLEAVQCPVEAADILQEAIRRRLTTAPEHDRVVRQLVAEVIRAGGDPALRVERLAGELDLSERQLHRRCSAALGYGPKTFARIVRFQRFIERARSAPARSLGELAYDSSYADQPHLTREARRLAGVSPAVLLAELAG